MNSENSTKILTKSLDHIANINWVLKNVKFNTITNFIYNDHRELIITTNSIASLSDLSIIKNYIKNIDVIQLENIYILINSKLVEQVIQLMHVFNNICVMTLA